MPCATDSKKLCTIGGMVASNPAMGNYVRELKVVFSDGNEYAVKPLGKPELNQKMDQRNFEGFVYRSIFNLIEKSKDEIVKAQDELEKKMIPIQSQLQDLQKQFDALPKEETKKSDPK